MSLHSRLIALLIGVIIIFCIMIFVRKKYLDSLYSFMWILIGFFFILISVFPKIVNFISIALGIDFSPIGILVISILVLGIIILHLSTIVTTHNKKIREFEKKIALMINNKDD